jgi:hypothetical protein
MRKSVSYRVEWGLQRRISLRYSNPGHSLVGQNFRLTGASLATDHC